MSFGVPIRPSGIVEAIASSCPAVFSTSSKASVATGPGATVLTRMFGANSNARVSLRLFMPAFAAAYGPVNGEPRVPAPELILTMELPGFIRFAAALHPWNAEVRLSSSCARKTSSGVSTNALVVFSSEPPTLLTQISIRPNRSIARSASSSEKSRISPAAINAERPRLSTPAAVTSRSLRRRALITTSHPASARVHAIARPIPWPEPVTTATRPVRSNRSSMLDDMPTQ